MGAVETTAQRYIRIIETGMVIPEGPDFGKPVRLMPWQKDLIEHMTTAKKNGFRKYRQIWLEIPRKNSKTTTVAMVALAHMLTTDNPQVIMAASTREQANLLFNAMFNLIQLSPVLQKYLEPYRRIIRLKGRLGEARIISADGKSNLGLNPSLICCDEVLAWSETKGPELWEALTTSMASRDSQLVAITTAGSSYTFGWKLSEHARNVAAGKIKDPTMKAIIYAASPEDDPHAVKTWKKANPSLGVTVREDYLRDVSNKAKVDEATMQSFKKLHLNIWTGAGDGFIESYEWDRLAGPEPKNLKEWDCYLGVDLASVNDFSAFVVVYHNPETRELYVKSFFIITEHGWKKRENLYPDLVKDWVRRGHVAVSPGQVFTQAQRMQTITALIEEYTPMQVFLDPWNANEMIEAINDRFGKDYAMAVRQTALYMSEPMKRLYSYAKGMRGLSHEANPVMGWMMGNLVKIEDGKENWVFSKNKSAEKIDGPVAFLTALAGIIHTENKNSVYNNLDFILGD